MAAKKPHWKPEEDAVLARVYPAMGAEAVCKRLSHRTPQSVHKRASRLGLTAQKRQPPLGRAYDRGEDELLIRVYRSLPGKMIMRLLPGRSEGSIRQRALALGITGGGHRNPRKAQSA